MIVSPEFNTAAAVHRLRWTGWIGLSAIALGWVGWVSTNVIANGNSHVQQRTEYMQIARDIAELKNLVLQQNDVKKSDRNHRNEVAMWSDRLTAWSAEVSRRNPTIDLPGLPAIPRLTE